METTTINLEIVSNLSDTATGIDALNHDLQQTENYVRGIDDATDDAVKGMKQMGSAGSKAMEQTYTRAEKAEGAIMAGVQATNIGAQAFTAYQGAVALAGVESEELEKTMIKVQGAMALAQGIQGIIDAGKQFKQFAGVAKTALQGVKGAVMATGIGLLVVAVGTLVAYWDDIKAAVSGVSKEQARLNEETKKNAEVQQKKLESIGKQENILKLQGKSEKEILQIKLKQTDEAIKALEVSIAQQEQTLKAQIEAEERNKQIIKGIIQISTIGIQMILATIDEISGALESLGIIDEKLTLRDDFNEWSSELFFDPNEVREKGKEQINEQKDILNTLKNDRAGLQLAINENDKQANATATADAQANAQRQLEIERQLFDMRLQMRKDGYEKDRDALIEDYKRQRQDIMTNSEYTAKQKQALLEQLKLNETDALLKLEQAEQERLEEVRRNYFDLEVETIKDQGQRELAINKEKYERLRADIIKDETLTAEQRQKITEYYTEQEGIERLKIESAIRTRSLSDEQKYQQAKMLILEDELRAITDNAEQQLAKFTEIQNQKMTQAETERDIALANTELTEAQKYLIIEEYNNKIRDINKETSDFITKTDEETATKKAEVFEAALDQVKQGLALLSEVTAFSAEIQTNAINKRYDAEAKKAEGNVELQNKLEQRRVADLNKANKKAFNMKKASDLASATIDGYRAVLSTYAQTPGGPILKGIAAGIAGAFSAVNIARIASQKFEGATFEPQEAGGGNGAEAGAGGTMSPQFNVVGDSGVNQLQQANQPLQAYVVSGNVTTAQSLDRERIETATL